MGFESTLRRLREAAGMSQAALAEASGIPVTTIRSWEQGRWRPRMDALVNLAAALGVGVEVLLAEVSEPAAKRRPGRPPKRA